MGLIFEWDAKKSRQNFKKHAVSFDEAVTVFGDPLSLTIPDSLHSDGEDRFVTVGESVKRRHLVVVRVERGDNIRILSARCATRRQRKDDEEGCERSTLHRDA